MTSELFDPGLQPERTELAWRRTCLSLAIGSLVAMRLLPIAFGNLGWTAPGVIGLALTGVLWIIVRRRGAAVNARLRRDGDHARLPDATLLFAFVLLVVGVGVLSLAIVGDAALRPG
ncbi:DUF202 domain-containing protein [Microbacterium gorillae]|uniref:DUF202 domain-containing protein n=1 Tax=Microbacterium gorillae TaxID=1231063 RepID=UPI00058F4F1B|nr:DUF202 domain-containing protein [Microbacterium gorillae]